MILRVSLGLVVSCLAVACSYDWAVTHPDPDAGAGASTVDASVDGGAAFSCAGALFCTSFDDGPLAQRWMGTFVGPGGVLQIEGFPSAPSGPNVLFASRPAQTAPPATAYATQVLSQSLVRGLLAFKVRPEQLDPTSASCLAGIVFGDGSGNEHLVRILVAQGQASLQEEAQGFTDHPLSGAPAMGAWSRMSVAVEVGGRIVVNLDDTVVLDLPADASWTSSTSTRIFVGIDFEQLPSTATSVRFDDVRFDGS